VVPLILRLMQRHRRMLESLANKAMHTELAAVPSSLYQVTRANRVIASVSRLVQNGIAHGLA